MDTPPHVQRIPWKELQVDNVNGSGFGELTTRFIPSSPALTSPIIVGPAARRPNEPYPKFGDMLSYYLSAVSRISIEQSPYLTF